MAEHHPDLVYSIVAIGTVSALSESLSRECSEQVGGRPWSEYLVPQSAEDVKVLFDISFHRLPRMPKFCYKHWLESMYDHRKEKVDLLEAALIKDEDVPNHQFKQVPAAAAVPRPLHQRPLETHRAGQWLGRVEAAGCQRPQALHLPGR
uniref:Uncharacterized protein n=1 Tax=Chenopodium quinoa TaxID=63459 RepID=A0A803LP68_CHEQI